MTVEFCGLAELISNLRYTAAGIGLARFSVNSRTTDFRAHAQRPARRHFNGGEHVSVQLQSGYNKD